MSNLRDSIFEWAESDLLKPEDVPRAIKLAELEPQLGDWRKFLQALLGWVGMILLVAGVIFFFAYNWSALPRMAKFGVAETALAAAFLLAWFLDIDTPAGKGSLCAAALLTGALLALAGQIYQTGADTFELFAYWALLILPWVLVGRFAPLWLLWVALIDLSVVLYFSARSLVLFSMVFGPSAMAWSFLVINVAATIAWEFGSARRTAWLNRWGARILGTAAGVGATTIGVLWVASPRVIGELSIFAYIAWLGATYWYYRRSMLDVFMISGGVFSVIVFVTTFLGYHLIRHFEPAGLLFIGLIVIAISSLGAWWIRELIKETPQ